MATPGPLCLCARDAHPLGRKATWGCPGAMAFFPDGAISRLRPATSQRAKVPIRMYYAGYATRRRNGRREAIRFRAARPRSEPRAPTQVGNPPKAFPVVVRTDPVRAASRGGCVNSTALTTRGRHTYQCGAISVAQARFSPRDFIGARETAPGDTLPFTSPRPNSGLPASATFSLSSTCAYFCVERPIRPACAARARPLARRLAA